MRAIGTLLAFVAFHAIASIFLVADTGHCCVLHARQSAVAITATANGASIQIVKPLLAFIALPSSCVRTALALACFVVARKCFFVVEYRPSFFAFAGHARLA